MSISTKYALMLGNLTRNAPIPIDPFVFGEVSDGGADVPFIEAEPIVSADLWARPEGGASYIGIRVTCPITDQHPIAADLIAAAVEREIVPVFLSWIGDTGMQRFGFRVELIGGTNDEERRACEEQLKRLWNLAIVVEAADISSFD